MLTKTQTALSAFALFGFFVAPMAALQADDSSTAGVVRISDRGSSIIQTNSATGAVYTQQCDQCDQCDGDCRRSGCPSCPICVMLKPHGVTYSPDHGFRRPVVEHIQRDPVEYRRYWPAKWYGEPGSGLDTRNNAYPMVYTPTDTTQLGYYYQRVPTWRPNPGMIPPPPVPSHWHRREVCTGCNNSGQFISGDPELAPAEIEAAPAPGNPPPVPPTPVEESDAPQAGLQKSKIMNVSARY